MRGGDYQNWEETVSSTDDFYLSKGRSYSDTQVDRWLARWFLPFVKLDGFETVLDLCSGDGVWSFGLLRLFPQLQVSGVDISEGAVNIANGRARKLGLSGSVEFSVHDCEIPLPFSEKSFDLVFARGVFIFNQHDMMRKGCLRVLDSWHRLLKPRGKFVSMYGSKPDRFGTYTPMLETKGLPTNLAPRTTEVVDFSGGKFNHSPASFVRPFLELGFGCLQAYHFSHGRHTLVSEPSWVLERP